MGGSVVPIDRCAIIRQAGQGAKRVVQGDFPPAVDGIIIGVGSRNFEIDRVGSTAVVGLGDRPA